MKKRKQNETRRFESEFLALPPLKMILVNTDAIRDDGERKTRTLRKIAKNAKNRKAIEKLIVHLTKM
jgi:hypothetical protein